MCRSAARLAAVVALAALAAGCGGGSPPLADVDGAVTLDGKPLGDVEVVFVPESGGSGNATAYTDTDGRFRLKSDGGKRDGAAVGSYRVLVTDLNMVGAVPSIPAPGEGDPTGPGPAKRRRFPASYADAQQTPLTGVEVKPGKQTLTLEVKARGK